MTNVGIVLISHSAKVVEGIRDIIDQVVVDVPIAVAGGTDEGEIGTSVDKILAAIESAWSDAGVVLLYDLGSAMMNAEIAVEMCGRGRNEVVVAEGVPLLEGAYVAAVESGMGKSLAEVLTSVQKL